MFVQVWPALRFNQCLSRSAGIVVGISGDPIALVTHLDEQEPRLGVPVFPPSFKIGKSPENDLCLSADNAVSKGHCEIKVHDGQMILEDLGSRNGTFINGSGERISHPTRLTIGSWFVVGRTRLAVVPPTFTFDQTALLESAYSTKGNVIFPSVGLLEERTEAYLVVDMIGSTEFLELEGEAALSEVVAGVGRILEKTLRTEREPFLQCTGDGFFACYGAADSALEAVLMTAETNNQQSKAPRLSFALHWGPAKFRAKGTLIGRHIHAVFSLEDLRHKISNPQAN